MWVSIPTLPLFGGGDLRKTSTHIFMSVFSSSIRGSGGVGGNPTPQAEGSLGLRAQLASGWQGRGCPLWDHIIYCPNQDPMRVEEGTVNNYTRAIGLSWEKQDVLSLD